MSDTELIQRWEGVVGQIQAIVVSLYAPYCTVFSCDVLCVSPFLGNKLYVMCTACVSMDMWYWLCILCICLLCHVMWVLLHVGHHCCAPVLVTLVLSCVSTCCVREGVVWIPPFVG